MAVVYLLAHFDDEYCALPLVAEDVAALVFQVVKLSTKLQVVVVQQFEFEVLPTI